MRIILAIQEAKAGGLLEPRRSSRPAWTTQGDLWDGENWREMSKKEDI
jgi:hypothetical protein